MTRFQTEAGKRADFRSPLSSFPCSFLSCWGGGEVGDSVTVIALHSTASGPTTGRGQHVVFLCKSVF